MHSVCKVSGNEFVACAGNQKCSVLNDLQFKAARGDRGLNELGAGRWSKLCYFLH